MRHSLAWLGLMALMLIMVPVVAADDDTDAKAKPDAKDQKQYDKLIKSGKSFVGKLVKVDADQHYLTVQVTYPTAKQDPQVAQNLARLQLQMVDAQRNRNPVERLKQMSHIQGEIERNSRNLVKEATLKIELDAPEEMKVRTMVLPVELDEKGKPRKLTEKEKRDLKGPDPTLPGYTGDFDSLKSDQIVEIYLAKQPPKSKAKDKDADNNTESSRPKIAMIVIRAEANK
jgi:hypothetical protein